MLDLVRRMFLIGGNEDMNIVTKELLTLERSMTLREILDEVTYEIKFENSLIIIFAYGDTAPDAGSYTLNNFLIHHNGSTVVKANDEYKSGFTTPNSFISNSGQPENNASFKIEEGLLKYTSGSTSCLGGSGTVVKIVEIPINIQNLNIDETLFIGG